MEHHTESPAGVSFHELFGYTDFLAHRWIAYFRQNPAALEIDIGGKAGTLGELVVHIFDVERYFANKLDGSAVTFKKLDSANFDALQQAHLTAYQQLLNFAETATADRFAAKQDFGPAKGVTARKMLTQAALHSVHHWAQVAMAVRQAGFPTDRPQDIIISDVME